MKAFMMGWGLVIISALCDSYAATIVKIKFNELGEIDFSSWGGFFKYVYTFFSSPLLMSAVITFLAAPVLWFVALNRLELSTAYPVIVGLHLVFITTFAVWLVGEQMTALKYGGVALITLGMYLTMK